MKNGIYKKIMTLFFISYLVYGCSSGNQAVDSLSMLTIENSNIYMDEIGSMPVLTSFDQPTYIVRIHNNSNIDYRLTKLRVLNMETQKEENALLNVESLTGSHIAANTNSNIKIAPNTKHSISALLLVTIESQQGKRVELRKPIRINREVISSQLIIVESSPAMITSAGKDYSIALPLLLNKNFDQVIVNEGNLVCHGYKKGSACTLFLDGKISNESKNINLEILGYEHNKGYRFNTKIFIKYNDAPNLLMAYDSVISGSNNVSHIKLYNNGTQPAKHLNISEVTPQNSTCSDTLNEQEGCSFEVKVNSDINKTMQFRISYSNALGGTTELIKKILYFAELVNPKVEMYALNGSTLVDSEINSENIAIFEIANTSNSELNNLNLKLPYNITLSSDFKLENDQNLSHACNLDTLFKLGGGEICQFVIKYKPVRDHVLDQLNINLNGQYLDECGKFTNFFQNLEVDYSANDSAAIPVVSFGFRPGYGHDLEVPFISNVNNKYKAVTVLELRNSSKNSITLDFKGGNPAFLTFSKTTLNNLAYSSTCTTNLLPDSKCEVTIEYGPGLQQESIIGVIANLQYRYKGHTYSIDSNQLNLTSVDRAIATASVNQIFAYYRHSLSESVHFVDGDGSKNKPYRIYVFNNDMIGGVSYTITNVSKNEFVNYLLQLSLESASIAGISYGTGAASLSGSNLNNPSNIISTNCSLTAANTNFISESSCIYNMQFPSPRNLSNTQNQSYKLADHPEENWKYNAFVPQIRYVDPSTNNIHDYNFNVQKIYFAVNYAWIDLAISSKKLSNNPDELEFSIYSKFSIPLLFHSAELSITLEGQNTQFTLDKSSCEVYNKNNNKCVVKVTKNNQLSNWGDMELKVEATDRTGVASFKNYKIIKGG